MARLLSVTFLLIAAVALVVFGRREWVTPSRFEGSGLFGSSTPGERRFWALRRRAGALVLALLGLAMLADSARLAFGR